MEAPTSDTDERLARRYGKRSGPRWRFIVFATVAICAGVAFAAWVGFEDKPVASQVFAYDVVSDRQVTVTIDVVTSKPMDVTCAVYAQAEDQAVVGEKTIQIAADDQRERRIEIALKTQRRAVTGTLRGCEAT